MNFEELVGQQFDFHGVNCKSFCLNGFHVYTAVEDPDDGHTWIVLKKNLL